MKGDADYPFTVFTVELLAAAHGDGLWIEYGDPSKPRRILIDGGPASTYEKGLRPRVARGMAESGGFVEFELFVVTHIDADHIDVPLIFLRDGEVKAKFKDVWFNGWKQIAPKDSEEIFAPLQGEFLTSMLGDAAMKLPWNKAVKNKAVGVPDTVALPVIELADGMRLTMLSPGVRELDRLRARWDMAIRDFTPGDVKEARQRLELRKDYEPPDAPLVFGGRTLGNDRTPANGSSIAMLAEFQDQALLLTGDAHARVLAPNLRRLAKERGVPTVRVDAFKLPHHGSMANLTAEVLDAITCSRFLFSTNGDKFDHPDRETVQLILDRVPGPVEFHFNYDVPSTQRFKAKPGDRHTTIYGNGNLTVQVGA